MLIYFNDPRGLTHYKKYHLDTSISIQKNIQKHFPTGFDHTCTDIFINGEKIDPNIFCLDRNTNIFDEIRIINRQHGVDPLSWWVVALISISISVASYLLMPKPKIPNDIGEQKDSSNNKLTGQTNIARLYQAKPDIYGCVRCYPDLVKPSGSEYIDNIKYVDHLMCIGIGQYQLENFKYSQTPLDKITGTEYKTYSKGDVIESVRYQYASDEVNGQELIPPNMSNDVIHSDDYDGFITYDVENNNATIVLKTGSDISYWKNLNLPVQVQYTINADVHIRQNDVPSYWTNVDITYSGALSKTSETAEKDPVLVIDNITLIKYSKPINGRIFETAIQNTVFKIDRTGNVYTDAFPLPEIGTEIQIDLAFQRGLHGYVNLHFIYWKIDDFGNEIPDTRKQMDWNANDNTYQIKNLSIKIKDLDSAKYSIICARLNDGKEDLSDQVKVENIFICSYQNNFLVNDTLVYIRTKATSQATSLKELKFNVEATRKTIHYDRNNKEIYFNLKPSRSFADAVLHEYVYVYGRNALELDLDALYEVDDKLKAKNEKLGYFDFSFDDKDMSLGQRIESICNAARVVTYRDGQKWRFVRNEKKTRPVALFNSLNLVNSNDGGTVQKKSSLPSSYDSVQLSYVDATKDRPAGTDKKAYINLKVDENNKIISGRGNRLYKIELAGCRNYDQAMNRAQLEMRQILYQRTYIEDEVIQDANFVNKGDLVLWADTWDNSVVQGEVISFEDNQFYVDQELLLDSIKKYRVAITDKAGYPSEWLNILSFNNNSFTVEFNDPYIADNNNIQMGSIFIITETVSEEPSEFLLTNKTYNEGNYKINLVNYTDMIYEFD